MIQALPPSNPSEPATKIGGSNQATTATVANDLITSDPAAFTKQLKEIDNENEVLIVLKEATAPRMAKSTLQQLPTGGNNAIALPKASASTATRTSPGFAAVNAQSRQTVKSMLSSGKATDVRAADYANIITATLPAEGTKEIVAALLNTPNVDYIEANQRIPVQVDNGPNVDLLYPLNKPTAFADPVGSNPADIKHTFHNVLDAWDYTRGSGARIGILDSGFVDDYDSFGNCNGGGSGQPYGDCIEWDDNGHGTGMAGLTGANDNNLNNVGVMPEGLTVSMKIAQDCRITLGCGDDSIPYELETDDFAAAVTWAGYNNIDVLSMSFSTDLTSTVFNALYDAYHQDDILLLSSTGNSPQQDRQPQEWEFVMGIGGLNNNGGSEFNEEYEEVSALSGGNTLEALCPQQSICQPNGEIFYNPSPGLAQGGTSASTAITAGIAGLVRTHNPSLSASQVRQRLINTSTGIHNRVDAYVAVTNDIPLSVSIAGASTIKYAGTYNWEAMPEGGDGSYTYQWEYKPQGGSWSQVSTSKTYSRTVALQGQTFMLRVTVNSGSEQELATTTVSVSEDPCINTNNVSTNNVIPCN